MGSGENIAVLFELWAAAAVAAAAVTVPAAANGGSSMGLQETTVCGPAV